ncbi:MAG: exodeoxyribonuclease VII small subunit [Deltaproteobacteria bacterium]|nr:exodeoxyribonuclease VII small subunit [Deltaproteobacteria bacterium]
MKKESFEESLEKLETIVHQLEEGNRTLEDSLGAFEEGMKLVNVCEARLNEAQKKIEILMKDKDGKKKAKNFESEGSCES